ncbi:hypothetical protein R6Q59_027383 [Mikania micrantha]
MPKLEVFAFTLTTLIIISAIDDENQGRLPTDSHIRAFQTKCFKIPSKPPCYGLFMDEFTIIRKIMWPYAVRQLENCCTGLKLSTKQCLCNAIQQEYDIVRPKATNFVDKKKLLVLAQTLPKECGLGVKECDIKGPKV